MDKYQGNKTVREAAPILLTEAMKLRVKQWEHVAKSIRVLTELVDDMVRKAPKENSVIDEVNSNFNTRLNITTHGTSTKVELSLHIQTKEDSRLLFLSQQFWEEEYDYTTSMQLAWGKIGQQHKYTRKTEISHISELQNKFNLFVDKDMCEKAVLFRPKNLKNALEEMMEKLYQIDEPA